MSSCIYGISIFIRCYATFKKVSKRYNFLKYLMRPLCKCGLRPAAINYKKDGRTYYRSMCNQCIRGGLKAWIPRWQRAGYKMKNTCDKCGFRSPHRQVFNVYHVDGNLDHCQHSNLKTVCANCQRVLQQEGSKWRQGDLIPDL